MHAKKSSFGDVEFIGSASSLTASISNASIAMSDTGKMLINAAARNGSINVSRSKGPMTLETSNGDTYIADSEGSFIIKGGNNDVTIKKSTGRFSIYSTNGLVNIKGFKFNPASQCSIEADNGSIKTRRLRTLKSNRREHGLTVRARAFSSIKFPKERPIDSFPGERWFVRTLIKGNDAARLTLDAGSKIKMR